MSRARRGPVLGRMPIPGPWAERAACRGWPTEWWYPGGEVYPTRSAKQQKEDAEVARNICRDCPVSGPCHDHALRYREMGIWAGLGEVERIQRRRKVGAA